VLGFGDASFAHFCGYAADVDTALQAKGLHGLLPLYGVDRQSAGHFAAWGSLLGEQLGMPLTLSHVPVLPPTRKLVLAERSVYGMEVQAPVAVLRFVAPKANVGWFGGRLPRFEVGDLVGIVPPGSDVPRYYSLASASQDGVLEICVRKQSGGLCSEFLHALSPGDAIEGFIRTNPDFRPDRGHRPLILIGAGAGVAPLAGFVRHNRNRRPVHLFFGARDPASDFLYRDDLQTALGDGRLASLNTSFSRIMGGGYVQARLLEEAETLRHLVQQGAQIMVCGGREMAGGVREAIDACLAPLGLSTDGLKQKGLYLEDAY
jgi:sulfite reductase (NADPH) flavoprotein alpha-component